MQHICSTTIIQIEVRKRKLSAILKITKAIKFCSHAYRTILLMEQLKNHYVHKVNIVVQTFCSLRVFAKETQSKTKCMKQV